MLTPREYAFATPEIAVAMGLPRGEWGMVFCEDENGAHFTVIGDADYVRMLRDADPSELAGLELDRGELPVTRDGWPPNWE